VVKGISTYYVILTYFILKSQNRLNAQNILPKLILDKTVKHFTTDEHWHFYSIPVRNIGNGPIINLSIKSVVKGMEIHDMKDFIKPNDEFDLYVKFTLDYTTKDKDENGYPKAIVKLSISYEDLSKKEYCEKYTSTKYNPGAISRVWSY